MLTSWREVETGQDKAGQGATTKEKTRVPKFRIARPVVPTIPKTSMGNRAISPLVPKTIADLGAISFMGCQSEMGRINRAVRFAVRFVSRLASMFRKVDF